MRFLPATVSHEIRRGWSTDILPAMHHGAFDIVYIDGDHTYAGARTDIENALRLVKDGGAICGDDLELQAGRCDLSVVEREPTIDKHYDAASDTFYHPGVAKAVNEVFGEVSSWFGFWAMQKCGNDWLGISLDGMPTRIPAHLPSRSLIDLKALMMQRGLL